MPNNRQSNDQPFFLAFFSLDENNYMKSYLQFTVLSTGIKFTAAGLTALKDKKIWQPWGKQEGSASQHHSKILKIRDIFQSISFPAKKISTTTNTLDLWTFISLALTIMQSIQKQLHCDRKQNKMKQKTPTQRGKKYRREQGRWVLSLAHSGCTLKAQINISKV